MASTMNQMEERLRRDFQPVHLRIIDESHKHFGHPGAVGGGGHFQVEIYSQAFEGKTLLEQHRLVNTSLRDLLGGEVHALGLSTGPASDWDKA